MASKRKRRPATPHLPDALPVDVATDFVALISASGLLDIAWYRETNPDIAAGPADPVVHFLNTGWREGRRPNPYFDPLWYVRTYPDVAQSGVNPLLHYLLEGESQDKQPTLYFDTAWYRTQHTPELGESLLAHFLRRRHTGTVSPLPEFDARWYLKTYADVAAAGRDPFEHYLVAGALEGRNPSAIVNPNTHRIPSPADQSAPHPSPPRVHPVEPDARPPEYTEAQTIDMVVASGLFDADWYQRAYASTIAPHLSAELHFRTIGWAEDLQPNLYFDVAWYRHIYGDQRREGLHPIAHYLLKGESQNCQPCAYFDTQWYRTREKPDPGRPALVHFLHRRHSGSVSPLPEFDVAWYIARYKDIAEAGIDPFEHYHLTGFLEGRNPAADFDTQFYRVRYLAGDPQTNPLLHYRAHKSSLRLDTRPPPDHADVFAEVRRFTRPGPAFEASAIAPQDQTRHAKLLAFYLPQFHATPENDKWWGAGFTEWTSVARGMPRFAGHYQPRTPRDLGHYTLTRPVMQRQIELALGAGLHGFIFYFYWFDGHRLLDGPLESWLDDKALDFPFCLMWANENWTRRWDGSEHEVLMAQSYNREQDEALIDCFARHFRDPRYIRLQGRPLLFIYRADVIPDAKHALERWRHIFRERHNEDPILVMGQTFGQHDPRPLGFDAAVEFPPHKLTTELLRRNADLTIYDPSLSANVYNYDDLAEASLAEPEPDYPLIKTIVPGWDNDARRQGGGLVLRNATPDKYEAWMRGLIARARRMPFMDEPVLCINAWNEWAEGAYLEPDAHFGSAFLNATARAVSGPIGMSWNGRILLVGHDAFAAGAQYLALHLARCLRTEFGAQAEILLLGDGALAGEYQAAAHCVILQDGRVENDSVQAAIRGWARRGFSKAIVNTTAAAHVIPKLREAGFDVRVRPKTLS